MLPVLLGTGIAVLSIIDQCVLEYWTFEVVILLCSRGLDLRVVTALCSRVLVLSSVAVRSYTTMLSS